MKCRLTFKTPDVLDQLDGSLDFEEDDSNEVAQEKQDLADLIDKFLTYKEHVTVEFDSVTKTAKLIPK